MPDDENNSEEKKTPEEELAEVEKQLEEKEKLLDQATKQHGALKKEFEAKTKALSDVTSAAKAFAQSIAGIQHDVEVIDAYSTSKSQAVEHTLGEEKKKQVDARVKTVDDAIRAKRESIEALGTAAKAAGKAHEDAKKNLEAKQHAYKDLKEWQTKIVAGVQKLKDYRAKIQQVDDQNRPASAYVYLHELKKVRDQIHILTEQQFKNGLASASKDLADAEANVAATKSAWDQAKEEFSKKQPELKKLEDERLDAILKAVDEFNK
jgi:chromosome segregation ATPase